MKDSNKRNGKLFQIMALSMIFGASLLAAVAQTGKLTTIYDGRDSMESMVPSLPEYNLIKQEIRKNEPAIRASSELSCDGDNFSSFEISGMTSGSFTKTNVRQKAYLYELCRSGRAFGIGGIVVVEDSKVVAHYVYGENGLDSEIASLPDINQNGFSEIMLIGGGTGQGYTKGAVEIIELTAGGVDSFGMADTYEDNFGTEKAKKSAKAFRISVQPGKNPGFFRETYTRNGTEGKWLLAVKSRKYLLRRDYEPKFYKIS